MGFFEMNLDARFKMVYFSPLGLFDCRFGSEIDVNRRNMIDCASNHESNRHNWNAINYPMADSN